MMRAGKFCFRNRSLEFTGFPLLMGILNVTPDSFYDGGQATAAESAVKKGLAMLGEGASLLDIGGESTRPGYQPVTAEEEKARILPVIRELRKHTDAPLSIDTTKAEVAAAALDAGADIVNDISALEEPAMLKVVAGHRAGCILMHHHTVPEASASAVADTVGQWLAARLEYAVNATALPQEHFLCDPGIGFGKTQQQNIEIIRDIRRVADKTGGGILLAASRKSFLCTAAGEELSPDMRLPGTLAVAIHAAASVAMLRVHDVAATRQALIVAQTIHHLTTT